MTLNVPVPETPKFILGTSLVASACCGNGSLYTDPLGFVCYDCEEHALFKFNNGELVWVRWRCPRH